MAAKGIAGEKAPGGIVFPLSRVGLPSGLRR